MTDIFFIYEHCMIHTTFMFYKRSMYDFDVYLYNHCMNAIFYIITVSLYHFFAAIYDHSSTSMFFIQDH